MKPDVTEERFIPGIFSVENHLEHYHRYNWILDLVKDKNVIDAASGEGYGSFILSKSASTVTGIDLSESAIYNANKKYKKSNLNYLNADVTKLPFDDNSFDVFVSFETLEHHDKHHEMLREVKRVLKSDGIFIVSSPEHYYYSVRKNLDNPYHIKELYIDEFKMLINQYFKYNKIYTQSVNLTSSILLLSEQQYGGNAKVDKSDNIEYLIAVCSNDENKLIENNSVYTLDNKIETKRKLPLKLYIDDDGFSEDYQLQQEAFISKLNRVSVVFNFDSLDDAFYKVRLDLGEESIIITNLSVKINDVKADSSSKNTVRVMDDVYIFPADPWLIYESKDQILNVKLEFNIIDNSSDYNKIMSLGAGCEK